MKTTVLAGLAGSLIVAGAASAQFIGWGADTYLLDADGNAVVSPEDGVWSVIDLYATFSSSTIVVNTFNMNIVSSADFNHANGGPASWNPNLFFGGPGENPAIDSFVLIGGTTGEFGAGNSTNFDPSFDNTANTVVGGWFNGNPPNQQGATSSQGGFEHATWVGRFVIAAPGAGDGHTATLSVAGSMTASFGNASADGVFSYAAIPAPGALALLGLAGLAGTRRRRA